MKCEICGQGPMNGVTVYRTGEKGSGKDPHWRCQFHMTAEQRPDDEVASLVAIIERDNESPTEH